MSIADDHVIGLGKIDALFASRHENRKSTFSHLQDPGRSTDDNVIVENIDFLVEFLDSETSRSCWSEYQAVDRS